MKNKIILLLITLMTTVPYAFAEGEAKPQEEESEEEIDYLAPKTPEFEYPPNYKEKSIHDADLPNKLCQEYEILGQDAHKRYNFFFLNDDEILMAIANTFQIFNIKT